MLFGGRISVNGRMYASRYRSCRSQKFTWILMMKKQVQAMETHLNKSYETVFIKRVRNDRWLVVNFKFTYLEKRLKTQRYHLIKMAPHKHKVLIAIQTNSCKHSNCAWTAWANMAKSLRPSKRSLQGSCSKALNSLSTRAVMTKNWRWGYYCTTITGISHDNLTMV